MNLTRPMMHKSHVDLITAKLLDSKSPVIVHEWGCGGSTVYWAKLLYENDKPFHWTSIEHSPQWADAVRSATAGLPVDVRVFDYGTKDVRWLRCHSYVNSMTRHADVVIVDGRKRVRCVERAAEMVCAGGTIFLHDAERDYYRNVLDLPLRVARHAAPNGQELWEMTRENGPQRPYHWQSDI